MKTEPLAILFADISRSTQMYDSLGDTVALQTIGRCISLLTQVVEDNKGMVVKTIGDEVMASLPGADSAVLTAAAMQEKVIQEFPEESTKIRLRIGLNYGEVVRTEGDMFGDTVNIAARLVKLANPGQILTSQTTVASLATDLSSRIRPLGSFPIKGKKELIKVYEVLLAQRDPELTLAPGQSVNLDMPQEYLLLRHGEKELLLHEPGRVIRMGRDPSHEFVINDKMASRNHAQIEFAHGRFLLTDHSTNGTFVLTDRNQSIHLHRDRLQLQGNGQISFGRDFSTGPNELVRYHMNKVEDSEDQEGRAGEGTKDRGAPDDPIW